MNTYESPSVELLEIVIDGGCCKSFKDDDSCYCEVIIPIISSLKK